MNGHLDQWLDAYLDGELNEGQQRRAEAHLETCPDCRAELEMRRGLSTLLRFAAQPAGAKSEQRFVSEISLRLPRKTAAKPAGRPGAVWVMAPPVALFLAWSFIQSVMIVVGILQWIPGTGDALRSGLGAVSEGLFPESVGGWTLPAPSIWDSAVLVAALVGIGVLFTGWFAGWIVSQRTAGSHK